jgi:hypothetical protein
MVGEFFNTEVIMGFSEKTLFSLFPETSWDKAAEVIT